MGNQSTLRVKYSPAVARSINPLDRGCRVKCDSDNRTFLLSWSKLVLDPDFSDADTVPGVTPNGAAGGM